MRVRIPCSPRKLHKMKFLKTVILGLLVSISWMLLASLVMNLLGSEDVVILNDSVPMVYEPLAYSTFFSCFFAPLWEEAAFRYAPIKIAQNAGNQYVIPVIIISSCTFGWGHGDCIEGVFLQGGLGFIFSFVYLQSGFLASFTVHAIYNIVVTFGPAWIVN